MFCPNCGSQLDDNARFCTRCGAAIGDPVDDPSTLSDASTPAVSPGVTQGTAETGNADTANVRNPRRKTAVIAVAIVAAAAVVGGIAVFLLHGVHETAYPVQLTMHAAVTQQTAGTQLPVQVQGTTDSGKAYSETILVDVDNPVIDVPKGTYTVEFISPGFADDGGMCTPDQTHCSVEVGSDGSSSVTNSDGGDGSQVQVGYTPPDQVSDEQIEQAKAGLEKAGGKSGEAAQKADAAKTKRDEARTVTAASTGQTYSGKHYINAKLSNADSSFASLNLGSGGVQFAIANDMVYYTKPNTSSSSSTNSYTLCSQPLAGGTEKVLASSASNGDFWISGSTLYFNQGTRASFQPSMMNLQTGDVQNLAVDGQLLGVTDNYFFYFGADGTLSRCGRDLTDGKTIAASITKSTDDVSTTVKVLNSGIAVDVVSNMSAKMTAELRPDFYTFDFNGNQLHSGGGTVRQNQRIEDASTGKLVIYNAFPGTGYSMGITDFNMSNGGTTGNQYGSYTVIQLFYADGGKVYVDAYPINQVKDQGLYTVDETTGEFAKVATVTY